MWLSQYLRASSVIFIVFRRCRNGIQGEVNIGKIYVWSYRYTWKDTHQLLILITSLKEVVDNGSGWQKMESFCFLRGKNKCDFILLSYLAWSGKLVEMKLATCSLILVPFPRHIFLSFSSVLWLMKCFQKVTLVGLQPKISCEILG